MVFLIRTELRCTVNHTSDLPTHSFCCFNLFPAYVRSHFPACTLNAAQTIETSRCAVLCRLATPERQDRVRIRGWPSHWELNWCVCGTRLSGCNKVLLVPPTIVSPATQLSNGDPWLIANCGFSGKMTFKKKSRYGQVARIFVLIFALLFFTTCKRRAISQCHECWQQRRFWFEPSSFVIQNKCQLTDCSI